jgi:GNAT superfamily N-acetyltransferase
MIQIIQMATLENLPTLIQLHSEMDGAPPLQSEQAQQIFTNSLCKGAVVVKANCRSQGIGKTMVKEALKISAAAGCYKATLSSNLKRDHAHAFYQSLGFQQHGWSFSLKLVPEA